MKCKVLFIITFILLVNAALFAQSNINGAWEYKDAFNQSVLIFQDGYFTETNYNSDRFVKSWGGPYRIERNQITIKVEFNSADSLLVGSQAILVYSMKNGKLLIQKGSEFFHYTQVDNGKAPLAGVWKISGREQDGKMTSIHNKGARKTLKILTGKRFQWFAINPETKQFSGTGGGIYSFIDGKYTENIQFFSRDNSRVGAKLSFDGKIENGQWHHSGLSSKGDKINEIWEKVL